MPCDGDATCVYVGKIFQERQGCTRILQVIGRHQHDLQMLACFGSFRYLLLLQEITYKLPLVGGRSFASTERIKEHETISNEHRTEDLSRLFQLQLEPETMLLRSVASAMIEHHGRKGTRALRLPEKTFQPKTTTRNLDSLRYWPRCALCKRRAGD